MSSRFLYPGGRLAPSPIPSGAFLPPPSIFYAGRPEATLANPDPSLPDNNALIITLIWKKYGYAATASTKTVTPTADFVLNAVGLGTTAVPNGTIKINWDWDGDENWLTTTPEEGTEASSRIESYSVDQVAGATSSQYLDRPLYVTHTYNLTTTLGPSYTGETWGKKIILIEGTNYFGTDIPDKPSGSNTLTESFCGGVDRSSSEANFMLWSTPIAEYINGIVFKQPVTLGIMPAGACNLRYIYMPKVVRMENRALYNVSHGGSFAGDPALCLANNTKCGFRWFRDEVTTTPIHGGCQKLFDFSGGDNDADFMSKNNYENETTTYHIRATRMDDAYASVRENLIIRVPYTRGSDSIKVNTDLVTSDTRSNLVISPVNPSTNAFKNVIYPGRISELAPELAEIGFPG